MSVLQGWSARGVWCAALLSCGAAMVLPGAALRAQDEIPVVAGSAEGRLQVLVEFADVPAARVYGDTLRQSLAQRRSPAVAEAAAVSAARSQIGRIVPIQENFKSALRNVNNPVILYQVQKAYNGIALQIDGADFGKLRRLPGVRAVHILETEYPTNSTSVPFIGAPNLWGNTLGLPSSLTGTGIRIGIIDTGIDYLHANFGGLGLAADYTANDRTVVGDGYFPTAKVVGGTDLAGDAYTGSNAPVPDPNPMDCNGHGSHVAGTAAGLGVDAAGATFTGPYDGSAPFAALRIGPGVAPGASLYAIRLFGCTGGTTLTVAGIDWTIDPNGDNDLSDHLDVINMSLGSDFGREDSASAQAADNAAPPESSWSARPATPATPSSSPAAPATPPAPSLPRRASTPVSPGRCWWSTRRPRSPATTPPRRPTPSPPRRRRRRAARPRPSCRHSIRRTAPEC